MFHFWFNTFFVAVNHEEHTVTLKSPLDGPRRTSRSVTTTPSSTRLPYGKPVQTSASSSTAQRGAERMDNRAAGGVMKPAAVRTSSGNSSASSASISLRRPSQQRDCASVRPHSVHLGGVPSGAETASNHLDSAASLKMSQAGKNPRDKLQASAGSGTSTPRSRPILDQDPKTGSRTAALQVSGRSKTASQEDRKTPGGQSSVPSARRGSRGSILGADIGYSVSRNGSVKVSHAKGDTTRTTPPNLSNGGSRKLSKENVVDNETTNQQPELSAATSTGSMNAASSTTFLSKTGKTDSATSRSVRQPNASTKAPSGVPRYIQRDLASRHVPTTNKTGMLQHTTFFRRMSGRDAIKDSGSGSRLVSPSVQARSEGLPSDPVSLTGYNPRNSRQGTSAASSRQASTPAEPQSSAVFDVSGSSCRPSTFCMLTLTKSEIDKANKDVQHKVYSSDFKVSATF